jgi:hypothetical protein
MRFLLLSLTCLLLSASACFAEIADKDQRARSFALQKLATDAKELNRCQAVVSVENLVEFEPIVRAYYRKVDELAKAIEDFVSRYADRNSKQETIFAFRYRVWDVSLQIGAEKARPTSALNRDICSALSLPR